MNKAFLFVVFAAWTGVPTLAPKAMAQTVKEVRAAGKQGVNALPQLGQYLSNADSGVRLEAIKQIVEIGGPRTLDLLIQATRDNDPEVQIRATDGIVNVYLPGYVGSGIGARIKRAGSSIKSRFTDTNDQVIDAYITVRDDVTAAVGKLVRGGASMESRANAARATGILRARAALPDIYQALRTRDTDVLYEAVVAIRKIRDESAGPKIQFLLHDLNDKVQFAAIETTGILQNRAALPDLRSLVNTARKDKIRRAALGAMAMLPDSKDRSIYTQYLGDKDDGMRAAAAEGLGRLRNPSDVPMLQKAYDDETKRGAQLALAFALVMDGKMENSEFSPLRYLINSLNSVAFRDTAAPFLTELAHRPEIRILLYDPMEMGTKDEKIYLARVLAGAGDRNAEPHLTTISRDPDPQVAEEGLRALRNLRARL